MLSHGLQSKDWGEGIPQVIWMRHLENLGISKTLCYLDLERTIQTVFCEHQSQTEFKGKRNRTATSHIPKQQEQLCSLGLKLTCDDSKLKTKMISWESNTWVHKNGEWSSMSFHAPGPQTYLTHTARKAVYPFWRIRNIWVMRGLA